MLLAADSLYAAHPCPAAQDDTRMLAASGDRTVSLWDTGLAAPLGTFRGHTGSVKSVCPQPVSNDVFASGRPQPGILVGRDCTQFALRHNSTQLN